MDSVLELDSHAKINLWLRILGRRDDGFHEVETRLCRVGVADKVVIERRDDPAVREMTCSDERVPTDGSNLVWRALEAFEQAGGARTGWRIHLEKTIPPGAGLGGGSSNAAVALRAFNQLTGGALTSEKLMELAGGLGSDLPCFLSEATAADGKGRGEQVTPVEFPWALPLVLIKPPFPVPTPWAYQHWRDSRERPEVPYGAQSMPWGEMVNDLERPVFEKFLLLPALKVWLLKQPETQAALMSGSGATVFAVASSMAEAEALAERAREYVGNTAWIQVTRTLSSEPT